MRRVLLGTVSIVCALFLSSCGEDTPSSSSPPTSAPTPTATIPEQIAALETSGTIPKLDRSSGLLPNDANGNGVRDDIDAYIAARTYSADGKRALTQFARGVQSTLSVDLTNANNLNSTALSVTRAVHCVFSRSSGDSDPLSNEILKIESMTGNTRERLNIYLRYNKALDGSVSAIPAGDTCE